MTEKDFPLFSVHFFDELPIQKFSKFDSSSLNRKTFMVLVENFDSSIGLPFLLTYNN